ncbi:unnamed protein product [Eruca vesicaria subsp. sativa]|uniref:Uncharacterized protein n=1 Tax=Eruca vesicaria subsp. sativa TaxID=29727 RepID=A0ABC8LV98_ERUVS|nr:unnamed protein product [Eruca vesicaria subsp. sativa]
MAMKSDGKSPPTKLIGKPYASSTEAISVFLDIQISALGIRCEYRAKKKKLKLRENWREKSKPIPPGGTYPAKDHCRGCGQCDTNYIAHVKDACAFLGDGMSRIESLEPVVPGRGRKPDSLEDTYFGVHQEQLYARKLKPVEDNFEYLRDSLLNLSNLSWFRLSLAGGSVTSDEKTSDPTCITLEDYMVQTLNGDKTV